jgi:hypothetical protein
MDVFDVATALTGDERELWTVDDAAVWGQLGAEVAQDGRGLRDGVL